MTSFNPYYLLTVLPINTVTLGVRNSIYEFGSGEDTTQSVTRRYSHRNSYV
jgi:hypothetical protein